MSWLDEDDPFVEGKTQKMHRKPKKRNDRQELGAENGGDDDDYKRKRAGKRSHRKKTHKDDFWEDDRNQRLQSA